jgi:hypothetical protein
MKQEVQTSWLLFNQLVCSKRPQLKRLDVRDSYMIKTDCDCVCTYKLLWILRSIRDDSGGDK